MSAMPAGLVGDGQQKKFSILDPLYIFVHNLELRRINHIISRIYGGEARGGFFQLRVRGIVSRWGRVVDAGFWGFGLYGPGEFLLKNWRGFLSWQGGGPELLPPA